MRPRTVNQRMPPPFGSLYAQVSTDHAGAVCNVVVAAACVDLGVPIHGMRWRQVG